MSRRRVALVTGGASGIGEATAVELAERGFRVAVSDVAEERGRSVAESLDGDGHAFYAADVSDANAVEQLVRSVTRDLGGLDAAVNNAGIGGPAAPTGAYPLDAWRKVLDVNLDGVPRFYVDGHIIQAWHPIEDVETGLREALIGD